MEYLIKPSTMTLFIFNIILLLIVPGQAGLADDRDCPPFNCDPVTALCPYPKYFANIHHRTICRACNVCIKPGTPVDSTGCAQLPCPKAMSPMACRQPWNYNSWVVYDGKRCKTCETMMCRF